MATNRPKAVVTRASEIPPATAPIPGVFWVAISWKALRMPATVPNRPTKGAVEPMVARRAETSLQLGVDDGLGPLEGALGRFDLLDADSSAAAVVAELLQAGGDNFSEVRLLVAVGDLDGFVELAFLQGSGNAGSKLARLLAGGVEIEVAVDHDGERPDGHDEQDRTRRRGRASPCCSRGRSG